MTKRILLFGTIIGFMDGIAACLNSYLSSGVTPGRVFQYIAGGIYGTEAFSGGFGIVALGVLIHFFIAIAVTGIFFLFYTKIFSITKKYLLHGAAYGVLVWLVMNLVVIPLSALPPPDPTIRQIVIGLLIHIFIIGIPISYFACNRLTRVRASAGN